MAYVFVVRAKTIKYVDDAGKVRVVKRPAAPYSEPPTPIVPRMSRRVCRRLMVAMDETGMGAHRAARRR